VRVYVGRACRAKSLALTSENEEEIVLKVEHVIGGGSEEGVDRFLA
jgi:hypothetical protein